MMKPTAVIGFFVLLAAGIAPLSPVNAMKPDGQVAMRLVRPDLVLEKIWTTENQAEPGKIKVEICYTIFNNSSVASSCCPTEEGKKAWRENPINNTLFYCSVESRVLPGGRFQRLPQHQGGVFITTLKPNERQTPLKAFEVLPTGSRREYRVRIDPENWIWEKAEDNNDATTVWPKTKTN